MQKLKCANCGFEGVPAAFGKRWALVRPQDVCLQCLQSKLRRQLKRSPWATVGWSTLAIAMGAALIEIDHGGPLGYVLLCVGIAQALIYPLIAVHEAGHAFAARGVGFDVVQVVLGLGRRLWTGSVTGIRVVVNAVPILGYTLAGTLERRRLRRRFFVYALGGVAVNGVLLLAGLAMISATPVRGSSVYWICVLYVFTALNGAMLVGNLIPHRVGGTLGLVSDGLLLIRAAFANSNTQDSWVRGYIAGRWLVCRELRDHAGGLRWSAKGLELFPEAWELANLRAITLLDIGDPAGARTIFAELLARTDLKPVEQIMLKNNMAFSEFLIDDSAHFAEADALSKEALAAIPWQPTFKSTRGAVLVALDRAAEAVPLLKEAFEDEVDPVNRGSVASVLAMAHARLGEPERAREWLERARALDGAGTLLQRAAAQVGTLIVGSDSHEAQRAP